MCGAFGFRRGRIPLTRQYGPMSIPHTSAPTPVMSMNQTAPSLTHCGAETTSHIVARKTMKAANAPEDFTSPF